MPCCKRRGPRKMSPLFSPSVSRSDGACSQGSVGTREDISLSLGLKGITATKAGLEEAWGLGLSHED